MHAILRLWVNCGVPTQVFVRACLHRRRAAELAGRSAYHLRTNGCEGRFLLFKRWAARTQYATKSVIFLFFSSSSSIAGALSNNPVAGRRRLFPTTSLSLLPRQASCTEQLQPPTTVSVTRRGSFCCLGVVPTWSPPPPTMQYSNLALPGHSSLQCRGRRPRGGLFPQTKCLALWLALCFYRSARA